MKLADLCIERPVLTLMLTLSLIVFGVLGYEQLGIDRMPNMEFPVVTVTARLEGAAPEVMEEDVTEVLEEQINTIAGLRSLRSTTYHGVSSIVAKFDLERDIDQAAQDVRDRIARARLDLPDELEPPMVQKVTWGSHPIMWIPLISRRSIVELSHYLRYTVKPYLETIPGVASMEIFGRRDREIRIWVDSNELRARGLAATDVIRAIQREHLDAPGGRLESHVIEYSVKTSAEFDSVEQLSDLIITDVNGAPVRLRDVARVEDGAEDPRYIARYDGEDGAGIGIRKQSQANTVAISDATGDRLEQLREFMPAGMRFPKRDAIIDFSGAIRESVAETEFALFFGAILATLTVLVFLRRMRPTMIVATAIPLSLGATFGMMWILGFTLNVMTLLALTLAVGVVIDDAIVVLENIERHREAGEKPFEAASRGTRQIAFAATAATLSIAFVFLPVVFIKGVVGSFLREFGLTVASAVLISLFVAFTLTPMLAARMPPPRARRRGGFYDRMERGFNGLERSYRRLLYWSIDHRAAVLTIAALSLLISVGFASRLGAEFFPPSDEGRLFVLMETPPGTSLEGTRERVIYAEKWVRAQPEVRAVFAGIGLAGPGGAGKVTNAVFVAILTSRNERKRSAQELMAAARKGFSTIPGLKVSVFDPASMFGGGNSEFQFDIRGNLEIDELDRISDNMIRELAKRPGFVDLNKTLKIGLPEIRVIPDREKAAEMGIDARTIASVVQATIGGIDVATFKEGGHRYDIRMRLGANDRLDPESIGRVYIRSPNHGVVELRNVARVEIGAAPATITRLGRQRSVTIMGNLEGIPIGRAVAEVHELAAKIIPEGASVSFSGSAQEFMESLQQFRMAIGLAVLVIYMLLAAQFESLLHPLTVMLALPFAMVGALGGLLVMGMTINVFSLIGIILLLGLVTKNSILLVDFAIQLHAQGMDRVEAMRKAAPIRMRPVLMTAISMVFGVLPAATGLGPGSETRAPMAVATGAGMLSSTFLTLLVVPVFYLVLGDAAEWVGHHLPWRSGSATPSTDIETP